MALKLIEGDLEKFKLVKESYASDPEWEGRILVNGNVRLSYGAGEGYVELNTSFFRDGGFVNIVGIRYQHGCVVNGVHIAMQEVGRIHFDVKKKMVMEIEPRDGSGRLVIEGTMPVGRE